MMPDPSAARRPSPSQARVKIVGNMIELARPIASSDQAATAPVELMDTRISAIAAAEQPARTLPGVMRASTAEPMKRPTSAPPQYHGI